MGRAENAEAHRLRLLSVFAIWDILKRAARILLQEDGMIINGVICCDYCHKPIGEFKHVKIPHFPKDETDTETYEYYHNRDRGDCFGIECRKEKKPTNFPKKK
jgi:hypothetical protein